MNSKNKKETERISQTFPDVDFEDNIESLIQDMNEEKVREEVRENIRQNTGIDVEKLEKKKGTNNVSPLSAIYQAVWDTINNSNEYPFKVMTNLEFYRNHIIDSDFIDKFIFNLKNNHLLVPIKIVNVTDLNAPGLNGNTYEMRMAIRGIEGYDFRLYPNYRFLSITNNNHFNIEDPKFYNNDHILLEVDGLTDDWKELKKLILAKSESIEQEILGTNNKLEALKTSNPEYHKVLYDYNKAKTSLSMLQNKTSTLKKSLDDFEYQTLGGDKFLNKHNNYNDLKIDMLHKLFYSAIIPKKPKQEVKLKSYVSSYQHISSMDDYHRKLMEDAEKAIRNAKSTRRSSPALEWIVNGPFTVTTANTSNEAPDTPLNF